MPRRDWMQHIAIVAGVALGVALFLCVGDLAGRGYFSGQEAKPINQSDCANKLRALGYEASGQAADDGNFCQQIRMAEAAEKAEMLSKSQYLWNVGQAISTVLAAFATGWAAWAAARAARSAHEGVELASLTAERELRAYVSCEGASVKEIEAGKAPTLEVHIRNSGVTPAHEARSAMGSFVGIFPQTEEMTRSRYAGATGPIGILDAQKKVVSGPKGPVLSEVDLVDIAEKRKALYLIAIIRYKDVFGKWCRSESWYMYNHNNIQGKIASCYVCLHGNKYEYDVGDEA